MSTESVPGWYPDDSGNMRYWDGQAWTSHTSTPEALDEAIRAAIRAAASRQVPDRLGTANNPVLTASVGKEVWPKWPLVVLVVGAVVLLFIVGAVNGGEETQAAADRPSETVTETVTADPEPQATETVTETATPKPKPAPEPEPEAGAIAVNAAQIVKEFENNEFRADTKYKGKTLRITGVVDKIDTDFWDDSKYVSRSARAGNGCSSPWIATACPTRNSPRSTRATP